MTVKRNFKRRVRQRQARTGESYVTARRHVLAGRPGTRSPDDAAEPDDAAALEDTVAPEDTAGSHEAAQADPPGDAEPAAPAEAGHAIAGAPGEPAALPERPSSGISVVELIDVSEEARRFGLVCRVLMFPALAQRLAPARVLGYLRDLLAATVDDPETALLASLALTGRRLESRRRPIQDLAGLTRFLQRARAGLGGSFDGGTALAFHVADGDRMVPILCSASEADTAIELTAIDEWIPARWEPLAAMLAATGAPEVTDAARFLWMKARTSPMPLIQRRPTLFLIHEQRRYEIDQDEFVIGRKPGVAGLAIKDGLVSRQHAAVIRRSGAYYLKDLGSAHGIFYKGMRIDNKRIDEGDQFEIAGHTIGFTYRA